ncbi:TlpA family protein disulfide reductase [Mucilaginibacter robiniae]|uniref:TlpA family protein disulfide reductase n=1 Tax=Mucilaginibacter robiniae TaxID=2728022 RepID=A0A7L5E6Y4_9SPHI|nr:TlpA disulfide reductase family protein [Mucilaginibacter robiniae]QJD96136.1 TlpA family protein disulfide reductase [Mucilaginibacter robiniae]
MKALLTTMVLLIATTLSSLAQFTLKGKILNAGKPDTLYLNIPLVYGYYNDNTMKVPVNSSGLFNTTIQLPEQKFATLEYKGHEHTLLLTPGKALNLVFNTDTMLNNFKGTAAPENQLMYRLHLNEIPFFGKQSREHNPYTKLSHTGLQDSVIKPWMAIRDQRLATVRTAAISNYDKRLIAQEVKADAITQLSSFARGIIEMNKRELINTMINDIYKNVSVKPDILPAGPQYYTFADSYIGYMEALAFTDMQKHNQVKNSKMPLKFYNISLDSANVLAKTKGKMFINWLAIRNNYDKRVAEAMLAQAIAVQCDEKDLTHARPLMQELEVWCPESRYKPMLTAKINHMEAALAANQNNQAIKIANGYDKLTSIYQIISQLKGKVVYLDIWGTWCPSCRDELRFIPQLKQHFAGKEVVFVYLDMDDDDQDNHWRNFIKINNMAGLHLRKSNKNIQSIWEELQPLKDKRGLYPTYFIFDKGGKLVTVDAKYPSAQTELYQQIEKYLE